MDILIKTPRIIIRKFVPEEEYLYIELHKDEQVTQFINKRTEEETRKRFKEGLALHDDGSGRWAMFNASDSEFIGVCGLKPTDRGAGFVELGYTLHQKYWGKGIAGEMAKYLIAHAFTHTPVIEITAVTKPLNVASQRVLEKTGFTRRENIIRDGEELFFFRIKKNERHGKTT